MAHFFEYRAKIDSMAVDGHNHCRPSAMLGILQEAATRAAVDLNIARESLIEEHNLFWMMARIWFRLEQPLHWNEDVLVRTWHRGSKGVAMYRDFDIFVGDQRVGESVSVWVLADVNTRKMARLTDVAALETTHGGDLRKSITVAKLKTPALTPIGARMMQYSDTDINAHVNNTRYADFACDALELHRRPADCFVQEMQMGYLAECRPGEVLELFQGENEKGLYIFGACEGQSRFETRIQFAQEEK